jgi:hypothetical protein
MDSDPQSLIVQCPSRKEQEDHPPLPRVRVAHVSLVKTPPSKRRACKDLTPYLMGDHPHPSAPATFPPSKPTIIPLNFAHIAPEIIPVATDNETDTSGSETETETSMSYPPSAGSLKSLLIKKPMKLNDMKEEDVIQWAQLTTTDLEQAKVCVFSRAVIPLLMACSVWLMSWFPSTSALSCRGDLSSPAAHQK